MLSLYLVGIYILSRIVKIRFIFMYEMHVLFSFNFMYGNSRNHV